MSDFDPTPEKGDTDLTTIEAKYPTTQRVECEDDLQKIVFVNDMAAIDVPVHALDVLPLKNDERVDDRRLRRLLRQIRWHGYNSTDPIIVRLGRRDRWVVVNGGHRITAARIIAKEFWCNLFRPKVTYLHFLLFRTELSGTLVTVPCTDLPTP